MFKWISSDHHFGHNNIIKYCNRPYTSVDEMDADMISKWNSVVDINDDVLYLGDFTLKGSKAANDYFSKLNGNFTVIVGNHDRNWIKSPKFTKNGNSVLVVNSLRYYVFYYRLHMFVLSHRPVDRVTEWTNCYNIHGHTHGNGNSDSNYFIDIGVDCNNFYPFKFFNVMDDYVTNFITNRPVAGKIGKEKWLTPPSQRPSQEHSQEQEQLPKQLPRPSQEHTITISDFDYSSIGNGDVFTNTHTYP